MLPPIRDREVRRTVVGSLWCWAHFVSCSNSSLNRALSGMGGPSVGEEGKAQGGESTCRYHTAGCGKLSLSWGVLTAG